MLVADFHNDFLTDDKKDNILNYKKILEKCVFAVYYDGKNNPLEIANEFNKNKPNNYFLGFENVDFIDDFDLVLKQKPLYCSLTWNFENSLAGGCYSKTGLTKKGKELVKFLTGEGIYIDTAHLNKKSFFEVIKLTDKIINSHTCFNGVFKHQRNIDDTQIKEIISRNGLVGLTLVSSFLGGKELKEVVKHIDYFVTKFGEKNICLGTDFYGTLNLPREIKNYSSLILLKNALLEYGYNLNSIENIFHKNLANFLNRYKNEKIYQR